MGLKSGLSKLFGKNKDGGAENRPTLDGAHPEYKTYEGVAVNILEKIKNGDESELQKIEEQLRKRAEYFADILTKEEERVASLEYTFVSGIHHEGEQKITKEKYKQKAEPILKRLSEIKSGLEKALESFTQREKERLFAAIPEEKDALSKSFLNSLKPDSLLGGPAKELEAFFEKGDRDGFTAKCFEITDPQKRGGLNQTIIKKLHEKGYRAKWGNEIYDDWRANQMPGDFWVHFAEKKQAAEQASVQQEFKKLTDAEIDLAGKKIVFADREVSLVPPGMDSGLVEPVLVKTGEGLTVTIDYQSTKSLQIEIIADKYTAKLTDSTGAIKEQNYEGSVENIKYILKNMVGDVNLRPGEDRLARLIRETDTKKAEAWAAAKENFETAASVAVDESNKTLVLPGGEVLALTASDLPHTRIQYKEIDGKQSLEVDYGVLPAAGGVIYPLSTNIFPPQRVGENFQIRSNVAQRESVSISLAELGEYLHKKAELASTLINGKETEFTEDEVEDITADSSVPPELPPELPAADTTDSGATHIDIPAVTTAQLDDNAATDPELPAVTQVDLADPVEDSHETDVDDFKRTIESLRGIKMYDEENATLSFEDESLSPVIIDDVPKPYEFAQFIIEPNCIVLEYINADSDSLTGPKISIKFNSNQEITKVQVSFGNEKGVAPIEITKNPVSKISETFKRLQEVLASVSNPAAESVAVPVVTPEAESTAKAISFDIANQELVFKGKRIICKVEGMKVGSIKEEKDSLLLRYISNDSEFNSDSPFIGIYFQFNKNGDIKLMDLGARLEGETEAETLDGEKRVNIKTAVELNAKLESIINFLKNENPLTGQVPSVSAPEAVPVQPVVSTEAVAAATPDAITTPEIRKHEGGPYLDLINKTEGRIRFSKPDFSGETIFAVPGFTMVDLVNSTKPGTMESGTTTITLAPESGNSSDRVRVILAYNNLGIVKATLETVSTPFGAAEPEVHKVDRNMSIPMVKRMDDLKVALHIVSLVIAEEKLLGITKGFEQMEAVKKAKMPPEFRLNGSEGNIFYRDMVVPFAVPGLVMSGPENAVIEDNGRNLTIHLYQPGTVGIFPENSLLLEFRINDTSGTILGTQIKQRVQSSASGESRIIPIYQDPQNQEIKGADELSAKLQSLIPVIQKWLPPGGAAQGGVATANNDKSSSLPDYLKAEMEEWNKALTQSYEVKKEAAAAKSAAGHHGSTSHKNAEHGSAKSGHADHAAGDHGKAHGKTHEKPHAPETIKAQELVFDHDTLYFKGKKIDFAVKGFKVSVVEKLTEPKLGQTIWLVPKHSDKDDHATNALGIALITDLQNTITGVRLLKEVVPDELNADHILTVVHEQETNVSNPEALVGLLKSVALYIEINKPLGELPKPPVKPDDREPDHGHGGHSDTHHDPHHPPGGGHGHGHDAPKQPELKSTPKPKAPAFPKWQEVEFGKQPVLDISSDFFFSFLQKEQGQESVMGKQVMDIYKKMVDSKADLVAEFANIFDDLPLTAELDEALEKQGITFEDFKNHWKESYHQEVYAIFKKAALADQATERNLRTTQLDKIGGVQGYAKKVLVRGGIMAAGAGLGGWLIDNYVVDLDEYAPEVGGATRGALAQVADKWLGSWWKKAAKWVGSVGEEDIANRKKAGIKRQSQELVKDLNDPNYYDYKMKSAAKWLSQGIRAASVKNAQSHENINAHLGATDDPNLYVLRIEAARALRAEFHEQGDVAGERLAMLDTYVNSLNQAHFDASRKKTEIQSKYQKPSTTEDSTGMKILKTGGKIYDWADTKIKALSGLTGAVAGVALWTASLPFRRLVWTTLAATKGSEIGDNLDKQALKTRQEKEVNALLLETRKVVDSYREGASGYLRRPDTKKVSSKKLRPNFNETFDNANIEAVIQAVAKLEAVLVLGVLNPALELEVQDTIHTIRKGVFFENSGDTRTFKLDLLEKETKGYGALAEQEMARLTERPGKWRKYLGFFAGVVAGKTFGNSLGFGSK